MSGFTKKSFFDSFRYASAGIRIVYREEKNFRIQLLAACVTIAVGVYLWITPIEWAILSLAIAAVLGGELLNSAMERYIDIIKPRVSSYVQAMKDIMAGMVLIASLASLVVACFLFIPKILEKFFP